MQAPLLYPLKFQSIIKEKIWGGERLNHLLSKSIDNKKCGELWEIADVGDDVSVVENGSFKGKTLTQLIEQFKSDLLGHKVFKEFGSKFPLLVKFIDANRDLSIQVHPNDLQAKKKKALGKTEFWYVLEANEGATLYSGFSKCISPQQFELAINDQTITDQLLEESVFKGDAFFVPAGRIHNIGEGLVIAEIQQSSDITYRIHDFDRRDDQGNPRELHIKEALEVLSFEPIKTGKVSYADQLNEPSRLASCAHFDINRIRLSRSLSRDLKETDSFVIYLCLEGELTLEVEGHSVKLFKGDVYLVPAIFNKVLLEPKQDSLVLETYIP